jgi:hypothetical protein
MSENFEATVVCYELLFIAGFDMLLFLLRFVGVTSVFWETYFSYFGRLCVLQRVYALCYKCIQFDFCCIYLFGNIRKLCELCRSRGSSGSIVSDYGLDDRVIGVRSPAGAKDFSSNLCVQTGSGAHPASCTKGTGGPFPGVKRGRGVMLTTHPHLVPRL